MAAVEGADVEPDIPGLHRASPRRPLLDLPLSVPLFRGDASASSPVTRDGQLGPRTP